MGNLLLRIISLILCVNLISGCTDYKFQPVEAETNANKVASGPDDVLDAPPPTTPTPPPATVPPPIPTPTPTPAPVPPMPPRPPISKTVTESYMVPVEKPQADILILLDTSGSMSNNLEKLAKKFKNLIQKWDVIDWQIGVTNVAVNPWDTWAMMGYLMSLQGKGNESSHVLRKTDHQAQKIFDWTVGREPGESCASSPPWCMVANPEPLKTILKVMEKRNHEFNKDFFREGSYFVPIILSDSDENEKGGVGATQPSAVIEAYKATFGKTMKSMIGFSIVVPPGDTTCYKEENNFFKGEIDAHYGVINHQFAMQTGGFTTSICTKDYASSLEKISEHLRVLIDHFVLKNMPLPGTLLIELTPAQNNIKWKLDGQKLIFSESLQPGTQVKVSYEIKLNSSAK